MNFVIDDALLAAKSRGQALFIVRERLDLPKIPSLSTCVLQHCNVW